MPVSILSVRSMGLFNGYRFILGSKSPRRRELLAGLDIDFTVEPVTGDPERPAEGLSPLEIPEYLARHKSESFPRELAPDEVLITADTLVFLGDEILGKPADREAACTMLRHLSGARHLVLTGVAIRCGNGASDSFTDRTEVTFRQMDEAEIAYYVDKYKPYDKAGAYGIQEWIGYAAITGIEGSYFNVMGLPVHGLYQHLKNLLQ